MGTKTVEEKKRIKTYPFQLNQYMIDFLRENKNVFPLENQNIWLRTLIKEKMKKSGKWNEEFE